MLNKILFAILIIVIATLALFSVVAYDNYRTDRQIERAEQAAIEAIAEDKLQSEIDILRTENERLMNECTLGLVAYDLLDESEPQNITMPNCNMMIQ